MKKVTLLLLYAILGLTACKGNSNTEPIAKDSTYKTSSDSFNQNPAKPPAQNSDDPVRFSQ